MMCCTLAIAQTRAPSPSALSSPLLMQGQCADLCPVGEISSRPHPLEQWNAHMMRLHHCTHAQPRSALLPRSTPSRSAPSQSPAAGDDDLADFLSPVSPYRRTANNSSTANDAQTVRDLRPLPVLQRAMEHLLHCVLPRIQCGTTFAAKTSYLSDRFRQIKKEMQMQSLPSLQPLACIPLFECMLRFHLVAGYVLMGEEREKFDSVMNSERAKDYLQALLETCEGQQHKQINTHAHDTDCASLLLVVNWVENLTVLHS